MFFFFGIKTIHTLRNNHGLFLHNHVPRLGQVLGKTESLSNPSESNHKYTAYLAMH